MRREALRTSDLLRGLALCVALAGCALPAIAQLEAAIASIEPCGKVATGAIVTIKVQNRGSTAVEPLVFECTPKAGEPVVLRRVPGPYVYRAGRPTLAGGSQTYPIFAKVAVGLLAGARVRVIRAAPCAVPPPTDARAVLGPIGSDKRNHERGGTVEYAVLPIRNDRDMPLDVVIRAVFDKPTESTVLIHRRLEPRQQLQATFSDVPWDPVPDLAPATDGVVMDFVVPKGARITSAKLVDWCAVESGDPAIPASFLREAYAPWFRWEKPLAVSGRYVATIRTEGAVRDIRGRVGLSAEGAVANQPDSPPSPDDLGFVGKTLQRAFADLRRPSVEEAIKLCAPAMADLGPPVVLDCPGKTWDPYYGGTRLAVSQDRILGDAWYGGDPRDLHADWITEPFEGGYVVTERRIFSVSGIGRPTEVRRWRYGRNNGIVLPVRVSLSMDLSPAAKPWSAEIAFEDLQPDVTAGTPVPSPATDAVRAAWNSGYRYPSGQVGFKCRFEIRAGKDGIWRGVKAVKGTAAIEAFTGGSWGKVVAEVEGVTDESLRNSLASAAIDRFGMWTGRDFGARGDFERTFAGASFAERAGSPGVFDVTNGPCSAVTVKDGRVASLGYRAGWSRVFTWTKVGDDMVVTKAVTGPEEVSATFTRVGAWLVPTQMNYKGVFGDEKTWGTEEVKLTSVMPR